MESKKRESKESTGWIESNGSTGFSESKESIVLSESRGSTGASESQESSGASRGAAIEDWRLYCQEEKATADQPRCYACLRCSYKCRTMSDMRCHITRVHLKLPEAQCPQPNCQKVFTSRSKMQRHHRTVHLKEKPHVCELCQKSFRDRQKLFIHVDTHMDPSQRDKSFPCTVEGCSQAYLTREALRAHVGRAHLNHRPFECRDCHERFFTQNQLAHHVATKCPLRLRDSDSGKESKVPAHDPELDVEDGFEAACGLDIPQPGERPVYIFPSSGYGKVKSTRRKRVWYQSENVSIGDELSDVTSVESSVRTK